MTPQEKEAKQRAKNYMSLKGALEPKQETFEKVAEKWSLQKAQEFALDKFKKDTTKKGIVNRELILEVLKVGVLTGHKFGANWQAERMYSEEDMEKAFTNGLNRSFDSDFDRWFENFKKK